MFHQIKGIYIHNILRDQQIKTTPRFELAGKTQQELESELTPNSGKRGVNRYVHKIETLSGDFHYLVWEKGERPVVWLTIEEAPIRAIWKVGSSTFAQAESQLNGFFRIGIDTSKIDIYNWREYEQRACVSKQWRRILSEAARDDDTSKWYFTLGPIASSTWKDIERWNNSCWVHWRPDDGGCAAAR